MKRWVANSLIVLGIFILLSLLFILSPVGFRLGIQLIEKKIPGKMIFSEIDGNIFGPIHIRHIDYQKDSLHVEIDRASLTWHLPMLLFGKLDISDFSLDGITMRDPNISAVSLKLQHLVLALRGTRDHYRGHILTAYGQHAIDLSVKGNAQGAQWVVNHDATVDMQWSPSWHIHANGDIVLAGARMHIVGGYPTITLALSRDTFQWGELHTGPIELSVQWDFRSDIASHADIKIIDGAWQGIRTSACSLGLETSPGLRHIRARGQCTRENHPPIAIESEWNGKIVEKIWQGQWTACDIKTPVPWSLQKTAQKIALSVGADTIRLSPACWISGAAAEGRICVDGNYIADQPWAWHVQGRVQRLMNTTVPALFSANVSQSKNKHIHAIAHVQIARDNHVSAAVHLPPSDPQKINARIRLRFAQIKPLALLLPGVSDAQGWASGDFTVQGLMRAPTVRGQLLVKNGYVELPELRLRIHDIALGLTASDNTAHYTLTAKTGLQPLKLVGEAVFGTPWINSAELTGDHLLVFNTAEYQVYASPRLHIRTVDHHTTISGAVTIPKAIIKPVDFSTTTTLPDDVEWVGKEVEKKRTWNTNIDIQALLGHDILIDSKGLKSHAEGALQITQVPGRSSMTAVGAITLKKATFTTQGKILTLSPDSGVHYTHDALFNPHLNIQAYRIVAVTAGPTVGSAEGKTKVGLTLAGTVKQPEIRFFSIPVALSQGDIMSYLLFDQPTSGGGSTESLSFLIQALSNVKLGDKGKNFSLGQIKKTLRINELGVQQQTYMDALGTPLGVNQSSFVIGSYLSPQIYFRYNHGMLTDINIYQVRYLVDEHWSVQMETYYGGNSLDNGSGLDALYTVSRKNLR